MALLKCCQLVHRQEKLKQAVNFLTVISEENRLNILRLLRREDRCVYDIWQYLDLPQNLVSHHLKVLKDFGLLTSKKDGKKVIYSLNKENLKQYKSLMIKFI